MLDYHQFWATQSTKITVVDSADSSGLDMFAKLIGQAWPYYVRCFLISLYHSLTVYSHTLSRCCFMWQHLSGVVYYAAQ